MVEIATVWKQFLGIRDSRFGCLDSSAGGVFDLFQISFFHHDLRDVSIDERSLQRKGVVTFVSPVSMFKASRIYADSGIQKKTMMNVRAKAPPIA